MRVVTTHPKLAVRELRREGEMPRAHRQFVPGHIWHVTHRCHERSFLLERAADRSRYIHWLGEAKERFGLSILNYVVTSNHVHLLLRDTEPGVIAQSVQLIAGRTGQEFNHHSGRHGAFWQDRYHATAVETGAHLCRCIAYIDLNMVRAGVVQTPGDWPHSGYAELARDRIRGLCDIPSLLELTGYSNLDAFVADRQSWCASGNPHGSTARAEYWSAALAVGSSAFLHRFHDSLGPIRRRRREVATQADGMHVLRETAATYDACPEDTTPPHVAGNNTYLW